MKSVFDKLISLLKKKNDPEKISNLIEDIRKNNKLTFQKIAKISNTNAGKIYTYEAFNALPEDVKKHFVKYDIPLTFSIDLINEDESSQKKIILELTNKKDKKNMVDHFLLILKQRQEKISSWKEALDGKQLMHLATKAKSYDMLSGKQRSALYTMGRVIISNKKLSEKQRLYLNNILEQCRVKGLIESACAKKDQCPICEDMRSLLKKC